MEASRPSFEFCLRALLESDAAACEQTLGMVRRERVRARDGSWIQVRPDTVCLHGDGPHAVMFAKKIRAVLTGANIGVRSSNSQSKFDVVNQN